MTKQLSNNISPDIKNEMMRNIRSYLSHKNHGLREHQAEALEQVERFLRTPNGAEIPQQASDEQAVAGQKKGDFFEVVSATGTGKTRMFGTLAHAVDMPTLIVTPRNLLNTQTKKEFSDEIGMDIKEIAVYDSKQTEVERKRLLEGNPPPKFLITSYQSLPSLVKRHEIDFSDASDKHFRPLILLDEVHKAQGKETSKIIDGFLGKALVGGFTATDAGASETLFQGQKPIYNLGIVPAIERDLLCHGVRTGVIDVALDNEWIKNFANTPKGKDYREEDIEKFAREPAVVNAAVKFHLTHDDEQLGKLSRLPTVFFTQGVAAAQKGAEEYNKLAQELGIDSKAAYVSGKSKNSDQVIADFKAGKIQALWNDEVLEMGFDAPNATVCYSLKPTQVSHIAEQQLGRVTRRQSNKPEDNYLEKYGMDKVALAINIRGEGMNPILFGEVLGDKPAVYSQRGDEKIAQEKTERETTKTQTPQWIDNVKIHLNYDELQTVLSTASKERAELPQKTDEWLSITEIITLAKLSHQTLSPIYKSLEDAWVKAKENNANTFTAEGITIPTDKVGIFQSGVHKTFCLHKDMATLFSTPQKTDEWLVAHEMKTLARSSPEAISPVYKSLQSAWEKAKENNEANLTAEGITIPTDKAGIFQSGTNTNLQSIHRYYILAPSLALGGIYGFTQKQDY